MPQVLPVTDLQRNMKKISSIVDEQHEPVYLTRNGRAAYVLVEAEAYDQAMSLQDEVYEREIRINKAIQRGLDDIHEGHFLPLAESIAQARAMRQELGL